MKYARFGNNADHEIHITADIVIGIWHYYLNTLDKDYLYKYGLEIMIETADTGPPGLIKWRQNRATRFTA